MVALFLVGTLAMSYAWGMRGTPIGHGQGAMVPGASLGFFVAALAERLGMPNAWQNVTLFCGIGAAAMYYGGDMTYGQTIGLALDEAGGTFWHGMAGLFLKGVIWFGTAAGWLGMAVSAFLCARYAAWELPLALLVSIPLRILGVRLLNRPHQPEAGRLPAIYFSKNRPECWGGYLFVWVELLVWMVCRGDAESLLISTLAALGGGMGWFLGNLMQLWSHRPFKSGRLFLGRWNRAGVVNGWKIMECTIGAWGGCLGLLGFWLAYRRTTDAVVQTFEPWMQNQTFADVLTLVWLALLLAYSVCSIRLQAQPSYRPELDRLKKLGLISAESYAKKNAAATDQKPDGVSGLILSHGDACDRLVYATIPLLLMLSGSALAAQLTAGFVIVWVLMERMLFGRFEDFRHLTAIRIVFLSLSAVLLAAQLCLYPAGGLKPVVLLAIDTAFYTLLVLMNDFRPKNIRAMRAEHSGWIRFFGAKLTTDLYFICCTAVTLIWYAAAC